MNTLNCSRLNRRVGRGCECSSGPSRQSCIATCYSNSSSNHDIGVKILPLIASFEIGFLMETRCTSNAKHVMRARSHISPALRRCKSVQSASLAFVVVSRLKSVTDSNERHATPLQLRDNRNSNWCHRFLPSALPFKLRPSKQCHFVRHVLTFDA